MRRFRKTTWAMLIWTLMSGAVTVAWMSQDPSTASDLPVGKDVQVDEMFRVTLVSAGPRPSFTIENTTTSDARFDYSNITMIDSTGAEHEPAFSLAQLSDIVPAAGSISKELDFGNLGAATPVSYHWECDACDAGEAIGRALIFLLMGAIYWFGMLVLFIVWIVTRPARVVTVVVQPGEPTSSDDP